MQLNAIAKKRGQTLAQMALAWVLRDPRITSALIGARNVEQLDNSLDALDAPALAAEELAAIEKVLKSGRPSLQSRLKLAAFKLAR